VNLGPLRGPPAPFAGNDLIAVARRAGPTISGWMTPFSLIEAASSASASSEKARRGCSGLG
jgi:hypothetical protein